MDVVLVIFIEEKLITHGEIRWKNDCCNKSI